MGGEEKINTMLNTNFKSLVQSGAEKNTAVGKKKKNTFSPTPLVAPASGNVSLAEN